jgi:hypothetical protein
MNSNWLSRNLRLATHITIVCGLLAFSVSAVAQSNVPVSSNSDNGHCSNRTLNGDYGFTLEGTILGPNIPLRGLVMQHYDGNGNITQVDHVVDGGMPPAQDWAPGAGTYSVNPDCTGSGVINSSSSQGPLPIHFVIVNSGKQIFQVVDGNAVSTVGIKVN